MKQPKILLDTQPEMIRHLRADANYTILFLTDGKHLISGYSLNVFADLFDEHTFVRIDRSNLVSRHYISAVLADGRILLKNNESIAIPRRRKAMLTLQYPGLFTNLKTA